MSGLTSRDFIMWFRLNRMYDIRELDRLLNEEDGNVIADNVPIAFGSVELDSKTSNVSDCVLRRRQQQAPNSRMKLLTALPLEP